MSLKLLARWTSPCEKLVSNPTVLSSWQKATVDEMESGPVCLYAAPRRARAEGDYYDGRREGQATVG